LNETALEKIWFIVSPLNPFKQEDSLLNALTRFELVKEAIESDERIIAKDIEFQLRKPSYTIDTLSWLKKNYPEDEFSIIMGSDSFQQLHKWKNFESIIGDYKILVYRRPGFEIENKVNATIEVLNAPLLGISSTEIRDLIKKGKSIYYLVPEKVRKKIEEKQYYRN
jgi:nicotinate-nucleotide adenylyltransferase